MKRFLNWLYRLTVEVGEPRYDTVGYLGLTKDEWCSYDERRNEEALALERSHSRED